MARKLQPYNYRVHRDDELSRFVDLRAALPEGVTLASAAVGWSRRSTIGLVDVTDLFGDPACTVDPAAVAKSGGGTQGGVGWVSFTPAMDTDLAPGLYEMLLRVTLSTGEVVPYSQQYVVAAFGDPETPES